MITLLEDANACTDSLSAAHRRILERESAISPQIIEARGYRTVKRAEVPDGFAVYQRRTGLLIPLYSPDGTTTAPQLRPDRPRRDKRGKNIKYETPVGGRILADVHPLMLSAASDAGTPLWITEGVRKGDALASRGRCAISLIGVWAFRPKQSREMLPCFDHIALAGRRVFVAFDSDVMRKPEVAMALERLVGDLEDRGARPLVVYLKDAPSGGKVGIDDFFAAGGTVAHLEEIARPFTREDATRERMGRSAPLRERVEALWRSWRAASWKGIGGHSRREVMRAMIEDAERGGKVTGRGVSVIAGGRTLAERCGVSRKAVRNALRWLELDGQIVRDKSRDEARAADAAAYYVLVISPGDGRARGTHEGTRGRGRDGGGGERGEACRGRKSDPGGHPTRGPLEEIKRLRWSYVARVWTQSGYLYEYHERLGKIAGRALEVIVVSGGRASVAELAAALGCRSRDLTRTKTVIGERTVGRDGQLVRLARYGIIRMEPGGAVMLTDDWIQKLGLARAIGGEYEAEKHARERHARARRAYRVRNETKTDCAPTEEEMDEACHTRRESGDGTADELRRLSALAAAMSDYLERNPHDADQPPGWIATTLWALELYPVRVTPAAAKAALDELGGEDYRGSLLERARPGAA
jgi:hypothetical protein